MIDDFAVRAAYGYAQFRTSQQVLPIEADKCNADGAGSCLRLNPRVETYHTRIWLIPEAAMDTNDLIGIAK